MTVQDADAGSELSFGVDPAFAREDVAGGERTALDDLKADLAKQVKTPPVTIGVPRRPNLSLRFSTEINADLLNAWRKRSRERRGSDDVDVLKFSCLVIANQCEAVLRNGEVVPAVNGEPISFRHADLIQMTGAMSAIDAVRKLYGVDGDVINVASEVTRLAGYGDEELDVEDPTKGR